MRFLGDIVEDGLALGTDGREHDIDGGAHAGDVKIDIRAMQLFGGGAQGIGVFVDNDRGPQRAHALDMLIDGARADDAAARQRQLHLAVAAEHGAKQVIGGAHAADGRAEHLCGFERTRVDAHAVAIGKVHRYANAREDALEALYIVDMR